MRHLFFVHSNISLLSSLAVIKRNNIDHSSVTFLTKRINLDVLIQDFHVISSTYSDGKFNRMFFNYPKMVDKYIEDIFSDQKFVCYFEMMSYEERIFATNKNCLSFNFIEEGTSGLSCNQSLEHFTIIFRKRSFRVNRIWSFSVIFDMIVKMMKGYNIRLISIPFQPSNYYAHRNTNFYGFTTFSFCGVPKERYQILSFYDCLSFFTSGYVEQKNALFYVEDSFSNTYGPIDNEEDVIVDKFSNLIEQISFDRIIYLPRKNGRMRYLDEKVFQRLGVNPQILDRSVPFELVLLKSTNSKVFGGVSALLYYSSLFGMDVYTYFFDLKNRPFTVYESMSEFWDRINSRKL